MAIPMATHTPPLMMVSVKVVTLTGDRCQVRVRQHSSLCELHHVVCATLGIDVARVSLVVDSQQLGDETNSSHSEWPLPAIEMLGRREEPLHAHELGSPPLTLHPDSHAVVYSPLASCRSLGCTGTWSDRFSGAVLPVWVSTPCCTPTRKKIHHTAQWRRCQLFRPICSRNEHSRPTDGGQCHHRSLGCGCAHPPTTQNRCPCFCVACASQRVRSRRGCIETHPTNHDPRHRGYPAPTAAAGSACHCLSSRSK
jgi:hypothetical protein